MVQIIFVHGVSVRKDPNSESYNDDVASRRAAFTKYCFKDALHTFHDPYWGEFAAKPDLGGLYLNRSGGTTLGGGLGTRVQERSIPPSVNEMYLLNAAQDNFVSVLNTLSLILAESAEPDAMDLAERIADYLIEKENSDGEIITPDWVTDPSLASDDAFLTRLNEEIKPGSDVTLGLVDKLKKAAGEVLGAGLNLVDGPIEKRVRAVTPKIANFLGDVFVYLKEGENRQEIREAVSQECLLAAKQAQASGEKLIAIGHSMGANILYDIFTDEEYMRELDSKLRFPLKLDLFLSVGTQLGLLEELNLFKSSVSGRQAPFPTRFSEWWHVHNQMDILSFGAEGIFEGVKQFNVDTKANIIDAHSAYFSSPVFQKRLRKRLQQVNIISS